MLESILALGLLFWVMSILAFVSLIAMVENKMGGWSVFTILAYLGLLHWFSSRGWTPIDVFGFAHENLGGILVGVASYFVLGTGWSVIKWWSYVKGQRRKYDEVVSKFLKRFGQDMSNWSHDQKVDFNSSFTHNYGEERIERRPKIEDHKEDVFIWIGFWPFSATWTIIDDPVRRICSEIYDLIHKALQAISDSVWKDAEECPPTKLDKDTT